MNDPLLGFEPERRTLPLEQLLPVRDLSDKDRKKITRYKAIMASIREVGVIEPLMVYPQKGRKGVFLIMDGHLRYYALLELRITEVECLVSTDDESFTYNARVNRIAVVQEHAMIAKAVKNGVPIERIAAALNLEVRAIRRRLNLLRGIHKDAADVLKDKPVSVAVFTILRHVSDERQVQMARMMVKVNDFTRGYADALLMGTPKEQIIKPQKTRARALSPEVLVQMQSEMETLERDFKAIEKTYSQNTYTLTVIRVYIKRLLGNDKVNRYLETNYADIHPELKRIAESGEL